MHESFGFDDGRPTPLARAIQHIDFSTHPRPLLQALQTDQQLTHVSLSLRSVLSMSETVYLIVLSPVRLSSVTLVHPTQPVEIFRHVSTAFGTLATH